LVNIFDAKCLPKVKNCIPWVTIFTALFLPIVCNLNLNFTTNAGTVGMVEHTVIPSDIMESRKGMMVSQFFRRWYIEKLYSCAPDYPKGQLMNKFVRAICYFKYFLPPGTTIQPQSTCKTAEELAAWITHVTRLSHHVETNVLTFVRNRKSAKEAARVASIAQADAAEGAAVVLDEGPPAKKQRKVEVYATFECIYKYLNTTSFIATAEFAALKPLNVLDLATKAAGIPAVRFDSVTQFRSN